MNVRTPRDVIRVSCLADTHSSDWLHATPSQKLGLWLQNTDFVRALRFSLGIPICTENTCAQCGADSCAKNGIYQAALRPETLNNPNAGTKVES